MGENRVAGEGRRTGFPKGVRNGNDNVGRIAEIKQPSGGVHALKEEVGNALTGLKERVE